MALKLKDRYIIILKDANEKTFTYRISEDLFAHFKKELEPYRSESTKPKPVRCIETGEVFECARKAHTWLYNKGVSTSYSADSGIKAACKDKSKTAYGFHWEFVEEG